jgi:hypothetical protein
VSQERHIAPIGRVVGGDEVPPLARFRGVVGEIQASGAMAGWGTQSKNGSRGIIKKSLHTWRDSVKEKP